MKTKREYLDIFDKEYEKALKENLARGGTKDNFESGSLSYSVDGTVGYYINWFGEDALMTWIGNVERCVLGCGNERFSDFEIKVTEKLNKLFGKNEKIRLVEGYSFDDLAFITNFSEERLTQFKNAVEIFNESHPDNPLVIENLTLNYIEVV